MKKCRTPITIYEVARQAGVGIGTVSRALNDSPQISPQTRAKVLKVIRELNYQPHAFAQGLARRKTNTVGLILPFFAGYFYVELLMGIQRAIVKHKYHLFLYGVEEAHGTDVLLKRVLQERRVDGMLLISVRISDRNLAQFDRHQLPVVLLDIHHPKFDSVSVDNEEGAYLAVRHLIALNRRRIAIINGHLDCVPAQERLTGYRRALKEAGIPMCRHWTLSSDSLGGEVAIMNDGFNREAGYLAVCQLLEGHEPAPDAIFVASDIQALGVIKAIRDHGLRVPEDIAVVGFDDIELAELIGLTTMHQPIREMAGMAVERLVQKIEGEAGPERMQNKMHTDLIIRETCGARKTRAPVPAVAANLPFASTAAPTGGL